MSKSGAASRAAAVRKAQHTPLSPALIRTLRVLYDPKRPGSDARGLGEEYDVPWGIVRDVVTRQGSYRGDKYKAPPRPAYVLPSSLVDCDARRLRQFKHFSFRLEQYYAIILKANGYEDIVSQIRGGAVEPVWRSKGATFYNVPLIQYNADSVFILADDQTGDLVTTYPPDAFARTANGWERKTWARKGEHAKEKPALPRGTTPVSDPQKRFG